MGRRSSSGDGSTALAAAIGLRMIQCGRQTVPVVQPDGQVRQLALPARVADLVSLYPHHYVSLANAAPAAAGRRCATSAILPLDAFLDTGSTYVLLPLPRLFPSAALPAPRLCPCFLASSSSHDAGTGISALKAEIRKHWPSSKISPDDGNPCSSSTQLLPRRLWEPALETISEDRALTSPKEESASSSERENHKGKTLVSALNSVLRSPTSLSSSAGAAPASSSPSSSFSSLSSS